MKVGGLIDQLLLPESIEELKQAITKDSVIIGNGSNIIVSDLGIRNPVIKIAFDAVEVNGDMIKAQAGVLLPKLSRKAADAGLSGLEFACGIPGTLGGAVYMNAGAWNGKMCQIVQQVKAIDRQGNEHIITDCQFRHRWSLFHDNDWVITEVILKLIPADGGSIEEKMKFLTDKRKETQPLGQPSSGSIYKTRKAAKWIKKAGLKGLRVGGAEVSVKHASFIINKGSATFMDINTLIKNTQVKIANSGGARLELEIEKFGQGARKAAIVTLFGYYNYGQRLQNYAVTQILQAMGYEVETLCFRKPKIRNVHLRQFTHKYMNPTYITSVSGLDSEYDLVVVGSDQVFNPKYLAKSLKRPVNLISIAGAISPHKLISLSASFGMSSIPQSMKKTLIRHLSRYRKLSVREEAGQGIVKELIGKDVPVFLDPVMLIDGWDELASNIPGKYVFNFFVNNLEMEPRYST
jgi:UDP-N-acetylmuramate dehydrogenase